MNLYLLKRKGTATNDWDCARGFLVRAESGEAARGIVASGQSPKHHGSEGARFWLEAELSTCDEIAEGVEGVSGVLLCDFHHG